ncbi:class I SAM-dependent methyltransferase [Dongshaea marina]|uniref:class I SAM-dependent methyltransferase n=1 Tax=Dongshaea marina TaxID=2047966 RepID=UPI000D3E5CA3|nr:class I SAM-dependent methyltransferase [Dongshaea marina]
MNQQLGMTLERFEDEYREQPNWDIERHQEYFSEILSSGQISSPVLDIGCGSGDLSRFAASLGHQVLGIDFSPTAISRASSHLSQSIENLSFKVWDAFKLCELGQEFNTVLDCCFFHMLDDDARSRYLSSLEAVMPIGSRLYMLNLAIEAPRPHAPRAVLAEDIYDTFRDGWRILDCGSTSLKLRSAPDGVPATYASLERVG